MKSILVTGGAGFIGSNFIEHYLENHHDDMIINLDLLTYAGNLENLESVSSHPRYKFVQGDIRDRDLVDSIFKDCNISGVIHFAAESHVDNSIESPDVFMTTNINGTFNLLNTAYKYWMNAPFSYKPDFLKSRFLHVSTDEVYGSLGETGLFTEATPYAPNSPYSASKAASDMIVRSYFHTYGMNTVITNCSNNYGAKQHVEKLIPVIISNALKGNKIPIYGDGKNVRDWLFVEDHCRGIELAYSQGRKGETYNIGGRNEKTNLDIVHEICQILDEVCPAESNQFLKVEDTSIASESKIKKYDELITFVSDRPGHDKRYAIDASKIEQELGWRAQENFETGIRKTVSWYLGQILSN